MGDNLMKYFGHTYTADEKEGIKVRRMEKGMDVDFKHNFYYTDHNPGFVKNFLQGGDLLADQYPHHIFTSKNPSVYVTPSNTNLMKYFYTTVQNEPVISGDDIKTIKFLQEKCLEEMRREVEIYKLMGINAHLPDKLVNTKGNVIKGAYESYLKGFYEFQKIIEVSSRVRDKDKKLVLLGSYLTSSYTRIAANQRIEERLADVLLLSNNQKYIEMGLDRAGSFSSGAKFKERVKNGEKGYMSKKEILLKLKSDEAEALIQSLFNVFEKTILDELSKIAGKAVSKTYLMSFRQKSTKKQINQEIAEMISKALEEEPLKDILAQKMKMSKLYTPSEKQYKEVGTLDFSIYVQNELIKTLEISGVRGIYKGTRKETRNKTQKAIEETVKTAVKTDRNNFCKILTDNIFIPYFEQYFDFFQMGQQFKDVKDEFRSIVYSYINTDVADTTLLKAISSKNQPNEIQKFFGELNSHIIGTVIGRRIASHGPYKFLVFNTGDQYFTSTKSRLVDYRQAAFDTLIVIIDKNTNKIINSFGIQMKTTMDKNNDTIYNSSSSNKEGLTLSDNSGIWDYINPTDSDEIKRIIQFVNAAYPAAENLVENAMNNLLIAYSSMFQRIIYQDVDINEKSFSTANSFYMQNKKIVPSSFLIYQVLVVYANPEADEKDSTFTFKYVNKNVLGDSTKDGQMAEVDWSEGPSLDRNAFVSEINRNQLNDIKITYKVKLRKTIFDSLKG